MNREELITYLEENNLFAKLLEKMYCVYYPQYRKILGKSMHFDYLERIELLYKTSYFVGGYNFYTEEGQRIIYDEFDYLGKPSTSPIECFKDQQLTKLEIIGLIKRLPLDKLEIIIGTLKLPKEEMIKFFGPNIKIIEEKIVSKEQIEGDKQVLAKSMSDMEVSLFTMISIMGDRITRSDIENIKKIINKIKNYLSELDNKNQLSEEEYTLRLK